jgi:hypothetical protein
MATTPTLDFVGMPEVSLALSTGNAPFELQPGKDKNFGPDEWAWQFLRLNTRYQELFKDHGATPSTSYRSKFGIGEGLDPEEPALGRISRDLSWFFPLKVACPSAECVDLPEPVAGRFGYTVNTPTPPLQRIRRAPYVWFAVDCSVPINGQILGIEACLAGYKQIAQREGVVKGVEGGKAFMPLDRCGWFDVDEFDRSAAGTEELKRPSDCWSAIRIDISGPLKAQLAHYTPLLADAHKRLVKTKLVPLPPKERLPKRDMKQQGTTDGNWLKALVVCAQLSQKGYTARDIDAYLHKNTYTGNPKGAQQHGLDAAWDDWHAGRELRIEGYVEQARAFVKGDYRWLIHAQRP